MGGCKAEAVVGSVVIVSKVGSVVVSEIGSVVGSVVGSEMELVVV